MAGMTVHGMCCSAREIQNAAFCRSSHSSAPLQVQNSSGALILRNCPQVALRGDEAFCSTLLNYRNKRSCPMMVICLSRTKLLCRLLGM